MTRMTVAEATLIDVSDGAAGVDGNPGVSYTLNYNDLQASGGLTGAGDWKISNSATASATDTGTTSWTTSVQSLFLRVNPSAPNTNHSNYLDSFLDGDYIVFTSEQSGKDGVAIFKISSSSVASSIATIRGTTVSVTGGLSSLTTSSGNTVIFGFSRGKPSPQFANARLYRTKTGDAPSAPSATITWNTGALSSITSGWSQTAPTVVAGSASTYYFSDIQFSDPTGSSSTTTATGSTPTTGFNFDGTVTFTNSNTIGDGTNSQSFGALASASSVNLASQVSGTLSNSNLSSDVTVLGNTGNLFTNSTVIDGGQITTNTIDANSLKIAGGNLAVYVGVWDTADTTPDGAGDYGWDEGGDINNFNSADGGEFFTGTGSQRVDGMRLYNVDANGRDFSDVFDTMSSQSVMAVYELDADGQRVRGATYPVKEVLTGSDYFSVQFDEVNGQDAIGTYATGRTWTIAFFPNNVALFDGNTIIDGTLTADKIDADTILANTLRVGSNSSDLPDINGTTLSGKGAIIKEDGDFFVGEHDGGRMFFDQSTSTLTIAGDLDLSNLSADVISANSLKLDGVEFEVDSNGNLQIGLIEDFKIANALANIDSSGEDAAGLSDGSNGTSYSNTFSSAVIVTGSIIASGGNSLSIGDGGDGAAASLTVSSGNLRVVGDIRSIGGESFGGAGGQGGNVSITVSDGDVIIDGDVNTSGGEAVGSFDAGDGGDVTINCPNGSFDVDRIVRDGGDYSGNGNGGRGGNISITAQSWNWNINTGSTGGGTGGGSPGQPGTLTTTEA